MKVILLQNVPKLGQKGDIKDVNEGYARNMLLPRKLAKFASTAEINKVKAQISFKSKKEVTIHRKAHDLVRRANKKSATIVRRANQLGHLFAQVNIPDIADAISAIGIEVSEDWIVLDQPIKKVGKFDVTLCAYGEKGEIEINIEPEA